MEPIRLQRYLAMAGVASRRKSEQLIVDGAVAVNGETVTVLGSKVRPDRDSVTVDGRLVKREPKFYIAFNKPKGCVTSVTDDRGRLTVMDYLLDVPHRVTPVGRLDFYSEGVLLLTNDGDLAANLLRPKSEVEKVYHVKVRGNVSERHLDALRRGVRLDDGVVTKPARIKVLPSSSRHDWLEVVLTEGKSRQIHRMAEALGYTVTKLQRVSFAGIRFDGLRVGDARELSRDEVMALCGHASIPYTKAHHGNWVSRRERSEKHRRAFVRRSAEAQAAGPSQDGG